jgi:hypothetical protein
MLTQLRRVINVIGWLMEEDKKALLAEDRRVRRLARAMDIASILLWRTELTLAIKKGTYRLCITCPGWPTLLETSLLVRSKRSQVRGAREADERRRTKKVRRSEGAERNEVDGPFSAD